jgi:Uma2 family endonuclease
MQVQTRPLTPEDYLELEERSDVKHEYHDGEMIAMSGGTTRHNEIALNLAAYFKQKLRGQDYKTYIGDVKLWIPSTRLYTYPDVMLIRGTPIYHDKGMITVTNPLLIGEVLSKSTKNYDQGDKFDAYRSIPEFREYLLLDQTQLRVMQHVKTPEGKWLMTEYLGELAIVKLGAIDVEIPIGDLYDGVDLGPIEA